MDLVSKSFNNSGTWPYTIAPYMGYTDIIFGQEWGQGLPQGERVRRGTVYHCPSWPRSDFYQQYPGDNQVWRRYWGYVLGGYGMNRTLHVPVGQFPSGDWGMQLTISTRITSIQNPGRRMLVACGRGNYADLGSHWDFNSAGTPGYAHNVDVSRHGSGGNLVRLDGSALTMETDAMIAAGRAGRLHGYRE